MRSYFATGFKGLAGSVTVILTSCHITASELLDTLICLLGPSSYFHRYHGMSTMGLIPVCEFGRKGNDNSLSLVFL